MLVSIIDNMLVLAAILRTPSLRSLSIILLCSLAASDLLVGLLIQPVYIADEITRNSLLHQEITESLAFSACGVSLLTMTAMSVDRFLALEYHMRYPNLMTTNRSMYISATIWFISILLSFLSLRKTVYCFTIAAFIFACLLICSFCYIEIYRILHRHQLQIHAQQQAVRNINGGNNQNVVQRSMRSAKNTFIYYIVMILCYVPLFVTMSILVIAPHLWTNAWSMVDTLAFMNSSINPFLYCWRLRELRTAVLKTTSKMLCNQSEEN